MIRFYKMANLITKKKYEYWKNPAGTLLKIGREVSFLEAVNTKKVWFDEVY